MPIRSLITQSLCMVTLAIVLGTGVNQISPRGIPWKGNWDLQQGVLTADAKMAAALMSREIQSIADAKALFDAGETLFVDARPAEAFDQGRITGARSLPAGNFDELFPDFFTQIPLETPLVVYCSGRQCEESHHLAELLLEAGYTHVRILLDGFPGWQEADYPVEIDQ